MGYKYFKGIYEDYAKELTGIQGLKDYKTKLSDSLNTVIQIHSNLETDIEGLAGDAYDELTETAIGTILKQLQTTQTDINDNLEAVINSCDSLSDKLHTLENDDEELKVAETNKSHLAPVDRGTYDSKTDEYSNQEQYNDYLNTLEQLNISINKLIKLCEQDQNAADVDIALIDAFNTSVEKFSTQLFSLSVTLGNNNIGDFKNLSTEEKEKLVQSFIDELTNRYNALSKQKEELENLISGDNKSRETIIYLCKTLGMDSKDLINFENLNFSHEDLLKLSAFLCEEVDEDHGSRFDILSSYINGETSYEESGMKLLYPNWDEDAFLYSIADGVSRVVGQTSDKDHYRYDTSDLDEALFSDTETLKSVLFKDYLGTSLDYLKDLPENVNKYNETVKEMMSTNTTVYNMTQLKKHIPYFEYASEEGFKDFEADESLFSDPNIIGKIDKGIDDGYNYKELFENMDDEEKKMFAYVYEQNNGDLDKCRDFLKADASRINERIGYNKAVEFLEWVKEDNHQYTKEENIKRFTDMGISQEEAARMADDIYNGENILDVVVDHVSTFGKGAAMGFGEFEQNIQSLWEPSKVMTPLECESANISYLLSNEDSPYYSESLSAAYDIGKYIGKDGWIDAAKCIPGVKYAAIALDTASDFGEARTGYFRGSGKEGDNGESYTSSLYHAAFDTLTEKGVEYLMGTDTAKHAFGLDGITTNTLNEIGANWVKDAATETIKYAGDQAFRAANGQEVNDPLTSLGEVTKIVVGSGLDAVNDSFTAEVNIGDNDAVNEYVGERLNDFVDVGVNVTDAMVGEQIDQVNNLLHGKEYDATEIAQAGVDAFDKSTSDLADNSSPTGYAKKAVEGTAKSGAESYEKRKNAREKEYEENVSGIK